MDIRRTFRTPPCRQSYNRPKSSQQSGRRVGLTFHHAPRDQLGGAYSRVQGPRRDEITCQTYPLPPTGDIGWRARMGCPGNRIRSLLVEWLVRPHPYKFESGVRTIHHSVSQMLRPSSAMSERLPAAASRQSPPACVSSLASDPSSLLPKGIPQRGPLQGGRIMGSGTDDDRPVFCVCPRPWDPRHPHEPGVGWWAPLFEWATPGWRVVRTFGAAP